MGRSLRLFLQSLRYLWAAPYTALGLVLGCLAVLFGGRIGRALQGMPRILGFSAMTLGHVILAVDRSALVQLREHEQVHVRQYERWGPLFVPAYLLSSLLQLLRGRNPYRENHFERQAYAVVAAKRRVTRESARG